MNTGLVVLKMVLMPDSTRWPELLELRPAMVDHRHGHGPQDAVGHRRRPRNLQEMPAGAAWLVRHQVVSVGEGAYLKQACGALPTPGRDAIGLLELAGHVALVGKAAHCRSLGQRCIRIAAGCRCTIQAAHLVAVGAGAEAADVAPGRSGRGQSCASTCRSDHLLDVGVEEIARQSDRPQARRR